MIRSMALYIYWSKLLSIVCPAIVDQSLISAGDLIRLSATEVTRTE